MVAVPTTTIKIDKFTESATSLKIVTPTHTLDALSTVKHTTKGGVTVYSYELVVCDGASAIPFRIAGACDDFIAGFAGFKDWLQKHGVAEVDEVYEVIRDTL